MLPLSDRDLVRQRRPIVNVSLIVLTMAAFIFELLVGETGRIALTYRFGVIPAEVWQGMDFTVLRLGPQLLDIGTPFPNWLTIFTSTFLHAGWLHLLGNMLYLWVFGDNIEDRFGHVPYLLFYFAGAAAAFGLHSLFDPGSQVPAIGASGAIAAVLGAYVVLFPRSRIHTLVFIFFFVTVVQVPALFILGIWFVLQFLSGAASVGLETGVAYWAHVGGFILGAAVAVVYKLTTRQPLLPPAPPRPIYWRGREL